MGNALTGKWALVTGSTRGLGRTIAEWLAREGASIIVSGREEEPGRRERRGNQGDRTRRGRYHGRPGGSRRGASPRAGGDRGRPMIDILVNNAGMSIRGNFWDVTDDEWEYQVNVNVRSPVYPCPARGEAHDRPSDRGPDRQHQHDRRACLPQGRAVYNRAKAGVEAMTRNMAFEFGPYGISVNCVAPGNIAIDRASP